MHAILDYAGEEIHVGDEVYVFGSRNARKPKHVRCFVRALRHGEPPTRTKSRVHDMVLVDNGDRNNANRETNGFLFAGWVAPALLLVRTDAPSRLYLSYTERQMPRPVETVVQPNVPAVFISTYTSPSMTRRWGVLTKEGNMLSPFLPGLQQALDVFLREAGINPSSQSAEAMQRIKKAIPVWHGDEGRMRYLDQLENPPSLCEPLPSGVVPAGDLLLPLHKYAEDNTSIPDCPCWTCRTVRQRGKV